MDLREVTMAEPLKAAGYRTGVFGKWDGGRAHRFLPLQRGFDDFYGFACTGVDYWTHERVGIHSVFRGNERTKEDQGRISLIWRSRRTRLSKPTPERRSLFFLS
jgi:arylsulfatase A-like enzyme